MSARCLSSCGPCKELCARCIESYEKYYREAEASIVRNAKRALVSRGYTIIEPGEPEHH